MERENAFVHCAEKAKNSAKSSEKTAKINFLLAQKVKPSKVKMHKKLDKKDRKIPRVLWIMLCRTGN
jgi:hypothetical protein